MVRSWMADLSEVGIDNRSVNRKLSTLKSFYKFLVREGKIEVNPTSGIIAPKISKKLPSYVPEKDMESLFRDVEFENGFVGKRDRLVLEMFYATGMRRDELINLKVNGVNRRENTVKVLGKRNKERIIPLYEGVNEALEEYLEVRSDCEPQDDHLFLTEKGKKIYPGLIYGIVKRYLEQITTIQKKSPHVLRHTFATHMLNNGADLNSIKELLGHANLSATQVYTHNSMEKLKSIYKQAHPKA